MNEKLNESQSVVGEKMEDEPLILRSGAPSPTSDEGQVTIESTLVENPAAVGRYRIRFILALVACMGFMNVYALRVNLAVAIVAMVEDDASKNGVVVEGKCASNRTGTGFFQQSEEESKAKKEFNWNQYEISVALSSFFYGYIISQIPGGYLAERFHADRVFGIGVLLTSVLTLLTPMAARVSVYLLGALRFFEGLAQGVSYPSVQAFWSRWAPLDEKARLISISYAGAPLGLIFALPACGFLASNFGWSSVFYVVGIVGICWSILWLSLASSSPRNHKYISKHERDYILSQSGHSTVKFASFLKVPWRRFGSSLPLMAICTAHFGMNWGNYTYLTELPSYMNNVLGFSLKANGALSALPYITECTCLLGSGFLADYLLSKGCDSTKLRKGFNAVSFIFPAVFLFLVPLAGCSSVSSVAFLTLALGLSGIRNGGFPVSIFDIGPNHAGILMAISNTVATIPGFVCPLVASFIVGHPHEQTYESWKLYFFLSCAIFALTGVISTMFMSGKNQNFDQLDETPEDKASK